MEYHWQGRATCQPVIHVKKLLSCVQDFKIPEEGKT